MSTLKVNTIQDTTGNDALTIDSSGNVTASQGFVPSTQLSHRNLIINGAMQVAQRGTSSTGVTSSEYLCDRWQYETIGEETVTLTQSTDAPDGFANSFKVEITTADSDVTASDYAVVKQVIEAQNLQQLKYGSSDAETITVSFWVKSSVTGTYAVGLEHGETTSYISQTYSISSADTWEKKTVTFTGNTSTAINNDNGRGLHLNFSLSAGTNYTSGSNETWGALTNWLAGHSVNVIGTANATFQITGVQLEVGSVATPFEHRSYGEELARCQRYLLKFGGQSAYERIGNGYAHTTTGTKIMFTNANMRSAPSLSTDGNFRASGSGGAASVSSFTLDSQNCARTPLFGITTSSAIFSVGDGTEFATENDLTATLFLDAEL